MDETVWPRCGSPEGVLGMEEGSCHPAARPEPLGPLPLPVPWGRARPLACTRLLRTGGVVVLGARWPPCFPVGRVRALQKPREAQAEGGRHTLKADAGQNWAEAAGRRGQWLPFCPPSSLPPTQLSPPCRSPGMSSQLQTLGCRFPAAPATASRTHQLPESPEALTLSLISTG